jgi:CRP-like cAMP-binding protein
MTQSELLTTARLSLAKGARRGAAKADHLLMRSPSGTRRLVLTPAQAAILGDCFSKPATVPGTLVTLLGEHRCPPLDEFYELVLQAHECGLLVAEGEAACPTRAVRWRVRLPSRGAGRAAGLVLLAGVIAVLIPAWVAPAGWQDWALGWLAACAALSLGEAFGACALASPPCEVRGAGLEWRTLLPHFRVDAREASMDGRARSGSVALLRAAPVAAAAALAAWRGPALLAPLVAAVLYALAPWRGTAARQWLDARSAAPRLTVRSGFLFGPRSRDAWQQFRAWRRDLGRGVVAYWILWAALAGGACVRLYPRISGATEGALGSSGRLHPLLGEALYALLAAVAACLVLLVRALVGHWVIRRRLARPLRTDAEDAALAAALKGEPAAILRQVPLFRGLGEDDILALAVTVRLLQVAGGKDVFAEDEPADAFYILIEGAVEVVKRRPSPSSKSDVIGRLGPGDAFGEIALLDGTLRTATVRAAQPCQLLRLMKAGFDRLVVTRVGAGRVRELLQNTAFLGRLVFMAGWSFDELFRYAQKCGTARLEAGAKVLTQGAANNWFYLIYDGAFEARDGQKVLRRMQPGDYFGEISLLEHGEATADVVAVEESRCLTMTRADFLQFFAKDFRIGLRMEELAARRLGSALFLSR